MFASPPLDSAPSSPDTFASPQSPALAFEQQSYEQQHDDSLRDGDDSLGLDDSLSPSSPARVAPLTEQMDAAQFHSGAGADSLLGPLAQLSHHFDLQRAQADLLSHTLKTQWLELGSHNPALLLESLQSLRDRCDSLRSRRDRLRAAQEQASAEAESLREETRQLLDELSSSSHSPAAVAASASLSLSPLPAASAAPAPRTRQSLAPRLRASTAPSPGSSSARSGALNKRKSLRPAPPSPSSLLPDGAVLASLESADLAAPVSEREFLAVSSTVRARVKLADVNSLFALIQAHVSRLVASQRLRDASAIPPLSLQTLAAEAGASKIGGASGQCIIGTLRACKRIMVGKSGITLVKPPLHAAAK